MINTDKYEGHTPAPWTIDVHTIGKDREITAIVIESDWTSHGNCVLAEVEVENKYAETDAQLIADAPLLLEEVKQLREALVGDSKDWTTDELVEKIFTLYDKAHAWDKMFEYYSENEGTENDSQEDWEMREEMNRILREVIE